MPLPLGEVSERSEDGEGKCCKARSATGRGVFVCIKKASHSGFDRRSPFKLHHISSEHQRAGDVGGVSGGKGFFGIDGLHVGRDGGQCFTEADAVCVLRREAPAEAAVAELLTGRDPLRRDEPLRRMQEEAARVVLFRRAAARDADAGKFDLQKIRTEPDGLSLAREGDIVPEADIQPAAKIALLHGSIELQIAGLLVPDLRVDAQDGA